ncbi:MAG: hypothetical protein JW748_01385 [Anaerolineales bacterium]|nr:hypothetical protein [Anaerolineales bacterium]
MQKNRPPGAVLAGVQYYLLDAGLEHAGMTTNQVCKDLVTPVCKNPVTPARFWPGSSIKTWMPA